MGILSNLGYLAKSVGKSVASTAKKAGLKDYGVTEALGGNKNSVQYQNANVGNTMASKLSSPKTVSVTKVAPKPTVLGASTSSNSNSNKSSSGSSSSVSSYANQRAKDENRYASLDSDTSSLYKESSKKIAEAEKRAAEEKASVLSNLDSAQNALYNKLTSLENPEDAYNKYAQEAGYTEAQGVSKGLREQIDRVNKLLKGTSESVANSSLQSGLTETQRQRLIASEQDPLRTQMADLSTGLSGAVANEESIRTAVNDKLSAFISGQDQSLEPLKQLVNAAKDKASFVLPEVTDRLSREITQYTTERQTRLDTLLAKYSRAESLDDAELAEASQLAKEERSYTQTQNEVAGYFGSGETTNGTPTSATPNVQSLGNQQLDSIFGLGSSNPFNSVSSYGF